MKTTNKTLIQIKPNPTRCHRIEDPEQAASVRRLECQFYDQCLDVAIEKDWRGFSCNRCKAFSPLTPAQQRRDYIGLLELLADSQLLPSLLVDDAITDEEASEVEAVMVPAETAAAAI